MNGCRKISFQRTVSTFSICWKHSMARMKNNNDKHRHFQLYRYTGYVIFWPCFVFWGFQQSDKTRSTSQISLRIWLKVSRRITVVNGFATPIDKNIFFNLEFFKIIVFINLINSGWISIHDKKIISNVHLIYYINKRWLLIFIKFEIKSYFNQIKYQSNFLILITKNYQL